MIYIYIYTLRKKQNILWNSITHVVSYQLRLLKVVFFHIHVYIQSTSSLVIRKWVIFSSTIFIFWHNEILYFSWCPMTFSSIIYRLRLWNMYSWYIYIFRMSFRLDSVWLSLYFKPNNIQVRYLLQSIFRSQMILSSCSCIYPTHWTKLSAISLTCSRIVLPIAYDYKVIYESKLYLGHL